MIARTTCAAIDGVFAVAGARADTIVEAINFAPSASARYGLELEVQNFSKLVRRLLGVDVLIGGSERLSECRIAVPGLRIGPAERARLTLATTRTLRSCLPAGVVPLDDGRLALVQAPIRGGATAVRFDRTIRIVPRFAEPSGRELPRRTLAFRIAR